MIKRVLFGLLPVAAMAGDFDVLKAKYKAERDIDRRAAIVAEANSPTSRTEQRVTTNTAPASVIAAVQNLSALATNIAPIIAQTDLNFSAIRAYAIAHAAELTDAQVVTLYRMNEVWETVKDSPHLADGLANFRLVIVSTNTVEVAGPSPAQQRLGRDATVKDLE